MDWNAAIEKNREALSRVLAMLVGMAGLRGQFTFLPQKGAAASGQVLAEKSKLSPAPTLPRHLHRAVLRLLRPAEAAARRLIIVAARGIVVALPPARPREPQPASRTPGPGQSILRNGVGTGIILPRYVPHPEVRGEAEPRRRLCLPLLDPLPRWDASRRPAAGGIPRICLPGLTKPFPVPSAPLPDDPIDATRLSLRLQALGRALDDLPREARRFARWRARRRLACEQGRVGRSSPLKPGRAAALPKSFCRGRPAHEVHDILRDLHGLARWAIEKPDTS
jgi:hypothetical protein